MEKLKIALYVLLLAGVLTACSDDDTPAPVVPDVEVEDGEPTAEELAEIAAADRFAAANSVIRALAEIDALPDNWESATFEPGVGIVVDEANSDVRNMMALDADDARAYFLSIVPDLGLEGDTWSHDGVGSLTFRAVNEKDCYAVMDVNLVQMPGLKQICFVPKEMLGENKFWGTPYYKFGDMVEDSEGHTWICVRPAGGPKGKDYAYFVSFDGDLIQTKSFEQKIYDVNEKKIDKTMLLDKVSGKWVYAKNLVEERVAIWAGHAFAMLYGTQSENKTPYLPYEAIQETLAGKNFNLEILNRRSTLFGNSTKKELPVEFSIAYGSYESNKHKKIRQEKYLQPLLHVRHEVNGNAINEYIEKVWYRQADYSEDAELLHTPYIHSLTTDFDPYSINELHRIATDEFRDYINCYEDLFNINDYLLKYVEKGIVPASKKDKTYLGLINGGYRVIVMTQLKVKDNGKPNKDLTLLNRELENENQGVDYWEILQSDHFTRYVSDEKNDRKEVKDPCE